MFWIVSYASCEHQRRLAARAFEGQARTGEKAACTILYTTFGMQAEASKKATIAILLFAHTEDTKQKMFATKVMMFEAHCFADGQLDGSLTAWH